MFGFSYGVDVKPRAVTDAKDKAAFRNFSHAGARLRKDEKESIKKSDDPSAEGEPPHTRGRAGHNLAGSFRFDATKEDVLIGPIASYVGESGKAHEFGGLFRGIDFPERSFAKPALEKNIDRFAQEWAGSIGS